MESHSQSQNISVFTKQANLTATRIQDAGDSLSDTIPDGDIVSEEKTKPPTPSERGGHELTTPLVFPHAEVQVAEKHENLPAFSSSQINDHNKPEDLWIVIDGDVFDMTLFQLEHPGGYQVIRGVSGKDATKKFDKYHRRGILAQAKHRALLVGRLKENTESTVIGNNHEKIGIGIGSLRRKIGLWMR